MGFVNVFGGNAVAPSNVQYLALALSANTTLVWPLESAEGQDYLASLIDVTPSGGGLALLLPPAWQGATGIASVVTNVGASSFTIQDNDGGAVQVVAAGESYILSLTDNSTVDGVWQAIKLGAGAPSGSLSSALAGAGLVALGTLLASNIVTATYNTNQTLSTAARASANVWTGTAGTFTLDAIATVTAGWWAIVSNAGSGALTLNTTGGNTINGGASLVIPASGSPDTYSALIVATASGFRSFFFDPLPLTIAEGGTGATSAADALTNLGGTTTGISIFTAPSVSSILAILGITQSLLQEKTVSTSQVVGTNSTGTVYVATAGITLTLPDTSTATKGFYVGGYAQGGSITLTPFGTDAVNGGTGGASLTVAEGSSFLLVTDAGSPGNWWPLFLQIPPSGIWTIAAGTVDAITASYAPANTTLTDGLLLAFRASGANTSTAPTFAPDGLTAHAITKLGGKALVPADIPGSLAECLLRYNLANTRWELLNPAVTEPPWAAAGGAADAITATYSPAITTLYDGFLLGFRAAAPNATTTPTFAPNGLTAHTITKQGGVALIAGDIARNLAECLIRYNLANTRWELLNPAQPPMGSGTTGSSFSNLKVTNGSSPNTQVAVTANAVAVTPASGSPSVVLPGVNLVIDVSVSGLNGLDTGSVATSTWYSVWVIWNGAAVAGLLSTSSTSPTLPTGYTYFGRVGWMRTDGSSHFLKVLQYGNRARYTSPPLPSMASGAAGSISVPNWSGVGVSNFVPPTAVGIACVMSVSGLNAADMVAPNNNYGAYNSTTNPPPVVNLSADSTAFQTMETEILLESTSIYWASVGAGNLLQCYGWTDGL